MSAETKDKLKTGFLTIISNEAVVKAGRTYTWWVPLILAILSAFVALIPSFSMTMASDPGKSFLGSATYGYETGLVSFQNELEAKKDTLSFTISDKKINVKGWEDGKWITYTVSNYPSGEFIPTANFGFEVFYNDPKLEISDNDFFTRVTKNMNPYSSTPRVDGLDGNEGEVYRTNFIIFNETNMTMAKFPP